MRELKVRVEKTVAFAVRATLAGLNDGIGPAGETTAERETVPEKPKRLVTVRLEVAVAPAGTGEGEAGPAERLKSLGGLTDNVIIIE